VRALQIVHRTELTALRDGEDNKQKSYRCACIQHRRFVPGARQL